MNALLFKTQGEYTKCVDRTLASRHARTRAAAYNSTDGHFDSTGGWRVNRCGPER